MQHHSFFRNFSPLFSVFQLLGNVSSKSESLIEAKILIGKTQGSSSSHPLIKSFLNISIYNQSFLFTIIVIE